MKTLITTTAVILSATTAFAQEPNNYIGTSDSGVISERLGNDANTIITRDMATQAELKGVQSGTTKMIMDVVGMVNTNSTNIIILLAREKEVHLCHKLGANP